MKRCPRCKKEKELSCFGIDKRAKSGLSCYCKICRVEMATNYNPIRRERRRNDEEYRKKDNLRRINYWLKCEYGIDLEGYNDLFEKQNGVCAICGKPPDIDYGKTRVGRLCVDHDHHTGKLRGLLCHGCNVSLGFFKDDISILQKAIDYIKKNKEGD